MNLIIYDFSATNNGHDADGCSRHHSGHGALTNKGSTVFGGKREHDDLVIAAALAVWALNNADMVLSTLDYGELRRA